ncbi:MAG: hypothetical protein H5T47_02920 [Archaeoglobi archaeon]|nr:hypothetical protein [Candidatus Mnemosynella bozhongmuii]
MDDKILYIGSLNILSSWGIEDMMMRISGITRRGILSSILSRQLLKEIEPPKEDEKIA